MPPRDNELPEGTDKIINGAAEFGGTSSGGTGGSSSGFVASGSGTDTGGAAARGGTNLTTTGTGSSGGMTDKLGGQVRDQVASLKDQATDKVRGFADDGKSRATDALDNFSQVISEAADSIDQRLGADYAQYARRASSAVSGFADNLRGKELEDLIDDGRSLVRRSPGLAIGAAAVIGFALVRLVKSGLDNNTTNGGDRSAHNNTPGGSSPGGMGTGA